MIRDALAWEGRMIMLGLKEPWGYGRPQMMIRDSLEREEKIIMF